MRKILKNIRAFLPVNWIFRKIFKRTESISNNAIARWPVYGNIHLTFDNIPFCMYSKGDDTIVQLLYYNKHYHERKDLHLFLELAKNVETVFDIGANTGIYTILSNKVNEGAKIYSFEPYPVNIERLKRNLLLNKTKTQIVDKALGDEKKIISFAVPENGCIADTSSAEIEFSKNTYEGKIKWRQIEVEQTTLDMFSEENKIDKIDLVKIDVEGYEETVFKGATNFFKKYSPLVQCEILMDDRRKVFFEKFLNENDYTAYLILNDGLLRTDKTMVENPGSLNYIFSKRMLKEKFVPYSKIDTIVNDLLK